MSVSNNNTTRFIHTYAHGVNLGVQVLARLITASSVWLVHTVSGAGANHKPADTQPMTGPEICKATYQPAASKQYIPGPSDRPSISTCPVPWLVSFSLVSK
jgi:hypothetical protein